MKLDSAQSAGRLTFNL